jgi:hypothetical protein
MEGSDEIRAACGGRSGLSSLVSPTLPELARAFGLRDEPACHREIDEPAARWLLRAVLHRNLAYRAERIPLARAEELADRFLAQFGPGIRYFTNGTWHLPNAVGPDGVVCGAS